MRLLRLTMTAVGPFAGHVDLDFARLSESGLFLLEGPTGAGKSTIIDAVTFALYGKLAQSGAALERIRSQHASAVGEPLVELVFETQSGIYRVRRTPSYLRPKKRGTGLTPTHMTVKLWRLGSPDSPGELLSANKGDAEDEITRAVGLSHAQFVQTVVLPQGEFASFLRADTTAKRALLQRLFGTEQLARAQELLVEGRRAAEQRRAGAATALEQAVHSFATAADSDDGERDALATTARDGDQVALSRSVHLRTVELDGHADRATRAARRSTAARVTAHAAVAHEQDLERRRVSRAQLRRRQALLDDERDAVTAARDELAAAERARAVEPAAQALAAAVADTEQAADAQAAAVRRLPAAIADAPAPDAGRLREAAAQRQSLLGELAAEVLREQQLAARRDEHTRIGQALQLAADELAAVRAEAAALPTERSTLLAERERAVIAAAGLHAAVAEQSRAARRLQAAHRAVTAAEQAAQDQQITEAALTAWEQQEHRLRELRASWRASVASELGLALQSGAPCAVCGSRNHPHPARPEPQHVSQGEVAAAEAELTRLHRAAEACRTRLAEQRSELITLQVEADQLSPELAAATLAEADAAVATARAAADRQVGLNSRLATVDARIDELAGQDRQLASGIAALTEKAGALAGAIADDERCVAAARGSHASVAGRVRAVRAELVAVQAAEQAVAAGEAAVRAALAAGESYRAAVQAAGFEGEQWRAASRSAAQRTRLQAAVADFDRAWAGVVAQLSTDELTDPALDEPAADPVALHAAAAAAEAVEAAALAAAGAAADRSKAAARQAARLLRTAEQTGSVLADTAAAIRLGNLVSGLGDNQLRMELTTYVLVRRFAEIVDAANAQLRRISGGRYQLEHTDTRTGNARSGLGLQVHDLHTGRQRDPATLSGGETFYVSLALALGLADVVRAESGGVDLGTLFIDEGFGSLDPDVLDEVLGVLDGLRSGGRVVGIVSHVAELKARIADRVEVRLRADGSSELRTVA